MTTITSLYEEIMKKKSRNMHERSGWKHGTSNEAPFQSLAAVTGRPLQLLVHGHAGASF
jgi:hypothetical protein